MPRLKPNAVPSYRLHKQSGQAIVTFSGRDHLLGAHGSDESREKYNRIVAQWLAGGRRALTDPASPGVSVSEVLVAFWRHALAYYGDSRETENFKDAVGPVRRLYGRTPAAAFGPLALKAVRAENYTYNFCCCVRTLRRKRSDGGTYEPRTPARCPPGWPTTSGPCMSGSGRSSPASQAEGGATWPGLLPRYARAFARQREAARSIDTADEPSQNQPAMVKS